MVLIVLLIGIPIMLAVIFGGYIFYKGIKEKNKIKIIIPLIILVMVRGQIKGIILGILLVLYFLVILFLPYIIGIIISDYISSHNDFYYLTIIFNENWKVKSAYIKMSD